MSEPTATIVFPEGVPPYWTAFREGCVRVYLDLIVQASRVVSENHDKIKDGEIKEWADLPEPYHQLRRAVEALETVYPWLKPEVERRHPRKEQPADGV